MKKIAYMGGLLISIMTLTLVAQAASIPNTTNIPTLGPWTQNTTSVYVKDENKNVGIGYSTPNAKLDVYGGKAWFHEKNAGEAQSNIALGEFVDNPLSPLYEIITEDNEDLLKFRSNRYQGFWQFNRQDETGEKNVMFIGGRRNEGSFLGIYGNDGDAKILVQANDEVNDRNAYVQLLSGNTDAGGISALQFGKTAGDTNEKLYIQNNAGINVMSFDGDGSIGIGNPNPNKRLTIEGFGINSAPVEINDAGNNAWGHLLVLRTLGTSGGTNGPLILFQNYNQKNWSIGGEDNGYGFQIREDAGDGEYGSGFGVVRLHLAQGGNVGIGTNNPQTPFHVFKAGDSNVSPYLRSQAGGFTGVDFGQQLSTGNALIWNRDETNLILATSNTEKVIIDNTGNVGIGNMDPNYKLDVAGDIKLTGSIISDGDICIGNC